MSFSIRCNTDPSVGTTTEWIDDTHVLQKVLDLGDIHFLVSRDDVIPSLSVVLEKLVAARQAKRCNVTTLGVDITGLLRSLSAAKKFLKNNTSGVPVFGMDVFQDLNSNDTYTLGVQVVNDNILVVGRVQRVTSFWYRLFSWTGLLSPYFVVTWLKVQVDPLQI